MSPIICLFVGHGGLKCGKTVDWIWMPFREVSVVGRGMASPFSAVRGGDVALPKRLGRTCFIRSIRSYADR